MSTTRAVRPPFQPIELDSIDDRLEAVAAEKGIPTLGPTPTPMPPQTADRPPTYLKPPPAESNLARVPTPPPTEPPAFRKAARRRLKDLKVVLPEYAWVALRVRAAEEMTTVRFVIMDALRAKGIHIEDADMVEDGRRLR